MGSKICSQLICILSAHFQLSFSSKLECPSSARLGSENFQLGLARAGKFQLEPITKLIIKGCFSDLFLGQKQKKTKVQATLKVSHKTKPTLQPKKFSPQKKLSMQLWTCFIMLSKSLLLNQTLCQKRILKKSSKTFWKLNLLVTTFWWTWNKESRIGMLKQAKLLIFLSKLDLL